MKIEQSSSRSEISFSKPETLDHKASQNPKLKMHSSDLLIMSLGDGPRVAETVAGRRQCHQHKLAIAMNLNDWEQKAPLMNLVSLVLKFHDIFPLRAAEATLKPQCVKSSFGNYD